MHRHTHTLYPVSSQCGKGLEAVWPPLWADPGADPTHTLWLPPALEGIPVGHQLLQAFLVLEDGWQLLLGAGKGREGVSGLR